MGDTYECEQRNYSIGVIPLSSLSTRVKIGGYLPPRHPRPPCPPPCPPLEDPKMASTVS